MDKPNLRDVLSYYGVDLPSQRREQSINCPVHEESRPSCSVNEDEGLMHCLSCGFGGDAWSLIMKKEGFDEFGAAVSWAEAQLGFSRGDVSRPARRGRQGVPRGEGAGFRPRYRNTPVRGRPLSST